MSKVEHLSREYLQEYSRIQHVEGLIKPENQLRRPSLLWEYCKIRKTHCPWVFFSASIGWVIEDQAFLPSYDLAPAQPLPSSPVSSTGDIQEGLGGRSLIIGLQ